jgi:hypothetical protein
MLQAMLPQPLKARVRNGRLVLDEPTDLPEGEEVYLVPVDQEDGLDDEERQALHEELDTALDEVDAGLAIDAGVVMARLRART